MNDWFKKPVRHPITVARIPRLAYNRDWSNFYLNVKSITPGRLLHIYLVAGTDAWIRCVCDYKTEQEILFHIGTCAFSHGQGLVMTTEESFAKVLPVEMQFMDGWLLV